MTSLGGSDLLLLLIFVLASYIQATTGFAFGLIVMASVTALGLAPIEVTAFIVSILSLVNAATTLRGGLWRQLNKRAFVWISLTSAPTTFAGLWLLNISSEAQRDLLQGILGACLVSSSLLMMYRVTQLKKPSSPPAFAMSGLLAGLMGGLFATAGPPITFMMYRQPDPMTTIRATLLCLFSLSAIFRIGGVVVSEPISGNIISLSALGAPAVILGASVARHFPPPISNLTLRRIAFGLLLVSGISLMLKGLV